LGEYVDSSACFLGCAILPRPRRLLRKMEAESAFPQQMESKVLHEAVARGKAEDERQFGRTKAWFVLMVAGMMATSAACITWGGRVDATPSRRNDMDDTVMFTGDDSCNALEGPGSQDARTAWPVSAKKKKKQDTKTFINHGCVQKKRNHGTPDNAKNNLGPLGALCGQKHLEFCDDAKKTIIAKYSSMNCDELDALIATGKDALEKLEADFKAFVVTLDKQREAVSPDERDALLERLREEYKQKSFENAAAKQRVKSSLDMAKAVNAAASTSCNSEL